MASTRSVCANALRASSQLARTPTAAATTRRYFAAAATSTFSARVALGKTTTIPLRSRAVAGAVAAVTTKPNATAARYFSSEKERVEDDYHQISANGSKIWDFEQMAELAKDPGNVVIVGTFVT